MAELETVVGDLSKNVADLKLKSDKIEGVEKKANDIELVAKAAQLTADEAKTAAANAKIEGEKIATDLNTIKAWQVSKDEADKLNQKALNDMLKKKTTMKDGEGESFGDILKKSMEEHTDDLAKFSKKEIKSFSMQLKASDNTFAYSFANASHSINTTRPGIIALPNRKMHIRSLIPSGTLDDGTFTFIKEVVGVGTPASWAEGSGNKSKFDVKFAEATVNAEYIAGYLIMSKKLLRDAKGMVSFLNMRLPELLAKAEDAQLLNGDGATPNIAGITHAGNFVAGADTADNTVERLIDAIIQLEELDRNATAVLVRPTVYGELWKNKASGSGEYDLPSPVTFSNGTLYIGGIPVFASTAATSGKYIVGDFQAGAQILQNETPSLEFFYEDGDNVKTNSVTVRIEERFAFPIYTSNSFIYGDTVPAV